MATHEPRGSDRNTSLDVALAFGLLLLAGVVLRPEREAMSRPPPYFAPPASLARLTFGYGDLIADSIWLRTVQDMDTCEQAKAGSAPTPSIEKPLADAADTRPPSLCEKGWAFRMLDSVTTIAPRFRTPYSSGALVLSVVTDDRQGAAVIFERGLKQFPNDWVINFRAAFHYMHEIGDLDRSADLLLSAARNGGPEWAYALAARVKTKRGQAALAVPILEEALKTVTAPKTVERLKLRLAEAKMALAQPTPPKDSAFD